MMRVGLPGQILVEELLHDRQNAVQLNVMIDNAAAEKLSQVGVSKQMRYLAKTQRVAEGWVRDQVARHGRTDRKVYKCGTKENLADLMTKALSAPAHWTIINEIGMMTERDFQLLSHY